MPATAFIDILRLAASHGGRIPAGIPDHYVRYVAVRHRARTHARIARRRTTAANQKPAQKPGAAHETV